MELPPQILAMQDEAGLNQVYLFQSCTRMAFDQIHAHDILGLILTSVLQLRLGTTISDPESTVFF